MPHVTLTVRDVQPVASVHDGDTYFVRLTNSATEPTHIAEGHVVLSRSLKSGSSPKPLNARFWEAQAAAFACQAIEGAESLNWTQKDGSYFLDISTIQQADAKAIIRTSSDGAVNANTTRRAVAKIDEQDPEGSHLGWGALGRGSRARDFRPPSPLAESKGIPTKP